MFYTGIQCLSCNTIQDLEKTVVSVFRLLHIVQTRRLDNM